MKTLKNNKGFTLAELLIVVAIIAVLVAIMIPTFGKQLEKAREAADIANLRAAYAEATIAYINDEENGNAEKPNTSGTGDAKVTTVKVNKCNFAQTDGVWSSGTQLNLPFGLPDGNEAPTSSNKSVTFTFKADGTVSVAYN